MSPQIQVDDVIADLDFQDVVSIIRGVQSVDDHGIVSFKETTFKCVSAIVQNNGAEKLIRLDDGSRISDSINVWCKYPLHAASPGGIPADKIIWNSQTYVVKLSEDWSRYGAGFYKVTCELITVNPV